jgi:formylglycine-generating enzyme required for sulfatase activity/tRNA A-37 threonylcarbamoyl transferase component Bud32
VVICAPSVIIAPTLLDDDAPTEKPAESPLPERYEDLGSIASGASADVRRVRDKVLGRVLAMKVLHESYVQSERVRARFSAEAVVTAQLQHPGIVAVHDRGELADGRLWFTMKEVRGRTLSEVIDEVHAASGPEGFRPAPSGWTFRRLVDAFARIAQAVAYAHRAGVVHRDLKPDNLMVGEFGEVLVMDWGLSRSRAGGEVSPLAAPQGLAPQDALVTLDGDILGTPSYMPPEQARGERDQHGPQSDVYALGAILHHVLVGRPPYEGGAYQVWRQVVIGPPRPIVEAARGGPPVPLDLAAIAERAMQREIKDRYPDAEALATEVLTWLDGARRRERALALLDEARAKEPVIAGLRQRAEALMAEARARLELVRPSDPIEAKRPAWALGREAAALGREAALQEADWLRGVHGALSQDPELPEAHAALADHYRAELARAELRHEEEDAARFEVLLRAHDRGQNAGFLRGDAALSLVTDPPGATVGVHRYRLIDRRLVPEWVGEIGPTPLFAVPLTRGSYVLRIRAPGHAEIAYPVLLERDGHWDGRRPGERAPHPIVLPKAGELGEDERYVPAGFSWTGGDPAALDALPPRRVWIDGFVMRRFPVTNRELLAFLNALADEGREAEALSFCPRTVASPGGSGRLIYLRDASGHFSLEEGGPGAWQLEWPVVLVDHRSAMAYAAWLAARTGKPFRLPCDLEREKAARGADGRYFPWGNEAEVSFACVAESNTQDPWPAEVQRHPFDESPYGARGLAGNTRDFCFNVWREGGNVPDGGRRSLPTLVGADDDFRIVKGGAWGSTLVHSRAAGRFATRPGHRHLTTGLRVVRSFPVRE